MVFGDLKLETTSERVVHSADESLEDVWNCFGGVL
jgi:hypothetical protein